MSDRSDQPVIVVERSDSSLGEFLLGLAVGAGLALLFAPRTGEQTRTQLKNTGRRLRSAAVDTAEDLQDALTGRYENARDTVEDGIDSARQLIDEKRTGARDAVDAGKAAVKTARSELERRLDDSKSARAGRSKRAKSDGKKSDESEDKE